MRALDHADRHIRYAARIALEHQPVDKWFTRFLSEKTAQKVIEAGIGLARQGDKSMQSKILQKLNSINLETQTPQFISIGKKFGV